MSKLITDSKVLMDLLFDGTTADDSQISSMIDNLKKATLTCSELCVTIDFYDFEETRKSLSKINMTLTETWRTLAMLQNDFKDINTTKQ